MRAATILTLVVAMTLAAGCREKQESASAAAPQQTTVAAQSLTPEQLGELGAQIHTNPDRAKELLSHHGLTEASFEKAIRDLTENPDGSRRYAAAYKRAKA